MKAGLIIKEQFFKMIELLPHVDKGILLSALIKVAQGEEPDKKELESSMANIVFAGVEPSVKEAIASYQARCEQNAKNARKPRKAIAFVRNEEESNSFSWKANENNGKRQLATASDGKPLLAMANDGTPIEENRREGKGKEENSVSSPYPPQGEPEKKQRKPRAVMAMPESAEEVFSFAQQTGMNDVTMKVAEYFWDYWNERGWKRDGGKVAIKDWHSTLRNWMRNEKNRNARYGNSGRSRSFDDGIDWSTVL